jgi:glutathione S-transferase
MAATLPRLYLHPFSSYCQKVLVALYENGTPFEHRHLEEGDNAAELAALWPIKRFPVLVENGRSVLEASCIIEYLQLHHPGPVRLIPDDPDAALEVRMLDRFFDQYVSTPQQKFVYDALRPQDSRDPHGVGEAAAMLDKAYAWLDARMEGRSWAVGEAFSLADCACWRAPRSSGRWMRHGRTGITSRWAHRHGTELAPRAAVARHIGKAGTAPTACA